MITIQESLTCEEKECGRKFNSSELLMQHYKKWHVHLYDKYNRRENLLANLFSKIDSLEKDISETTNMGQIFDLVPEVDIEQEENLSGTSLNNYNSQTRSINVVMTGDNFFEDKISEVTEDMIGLGTDFKYYSEIEEINLESRNIFCFKTERCLEFKKLSSLLTLNISSNFIKDITDLKYLTTLTQLIIRNNKIENISSCEYLEQLRVLDAEDNEIFSITSLNKCKYLEVLKIKNNKLEYQTSTSQALKNLKSLKELTIKNNPFLNEILGYRHLFIYRYPQIKKLDEEELTEVDREVARRFTLENNPISGKIRPNSTAANQGSHESNFVKEEDPSIVIEGDEDNKVIRIRDRVITKIEHVPIQHKQTSLVKKSSLPDSTNIPPEKMIRQLNKTVEKLKNENKMLTNRNIQLESELNTLKLELENSSKLNQDYELLIKSYKSKTNTDDDEKIQLRQQLEIWKREYCELLDKTVSTNLSDGLYNVPRPQTAMVASNRGHDIENILVTYKKRKNELDDSLSEEESDEDSQLDHLLRKSVQNLEHLKQEIK